MFAARICSCKDNLDSNITDLHVSSMTR